MAGTDARPAPRVLRIGAMALLMGLTLGGVAVAQESSPAGPVVETIDCGPDPRPFDASDVDLTGTWKDQGDGIYYVAQYDDTVWWSAMSGLGGPADLAGRNWSNVATGSLDEDLVLMIEWADVPRAHSTATGTVWAQAEADAAGNLQLRLIRDTGGSGVSLWTPCSPVSGPDPAALAPDGSYEADVSEADLLAAGAPAHDAAFLGTGLTTLRLEGGRFSIVAEWTSEASCEGSYAVDGQVIRLTYDETDVCGGTSDIQAVATDDGIAIDWIDCGPQFCYHASDRAFFQRVWRTVE